jgi:DNA-binding NarL/FixJ family response regulator
MNILIVEDAPEVIGVIKSRLARTGLPIAAIAEAGDWHAAGNQAVARAPDVILFDLGLPDSLPEQSIQGLRHFTRRFPVVVLSGQSEALYWRRSIQEAGAMDFLPKVSYLNPGMESMLAHAIFNATLVYHSRPE